MPRLPLITLSLLLGWLAVGDARERPFIDEPSLTRENVEEGAPWQEGSHRLPAYPEDGDLVDFQVDAPTKGLRYFIDGKHLDIGADGVVRYALVIKSASGAANASFEGIRCDTWDVKIYAFGIGRGQWKAVDAPNWERIRRSGQYRHHLDLHDFYLCDTPAYKANGKDEILRRMRSPLQRNESDRTF